MTKTLFLFSSNQFPSVEFAPFYKNRFRLGTLQFDFAVLDLLGDKVFLAFLLLVYNLFVVTQ